MTIYVFARNKETGTKRIVAEEPDYAENRVRSDCQHHNKKSTATHWLEYSRDKEYAK